MSRQTFCIIEISLCLVYEGNFWYVGADVFILEDIVAFVGPPILFGLLVMSALGFKAEVDLLTCVLYLRCATDSSYSPLVRHLLTSRRSA